MRYVISGCSGGGKSTLVDALALRGYSIAPEPGRKIVRKELAEGGNALPWEDAIAFVGQCAELCIQQYETPQPPPIFFDRSLVDAVCALIQVQPENTQQHLAKLDQYRYASTVFMAEPWPENFVNDAERQHSIEDAVAEYDRLVEIYTDAGYSIQFLPKVSVNERIEFIFCNQFRRFKVTVNVYCNIEFLHPVS